MSVCLIPDIDALPVRPYRLLAALAVPDANRMSLHRDLAAERARVFRVLADFDLLDLLAEGGAVAGAVLACDENSGFSISSGRDRWHVVTALSSHTGNSDLLSPLRHRAGFYGMTATVVVLACSLQCNNFGSQELKAFRLWLAGAAGLASAGLAFSFCLRLTLWA